MGVSGYENGMEWVFSGMKMEWNGCIRVGKWYGMGESKYENGME